MLNRGPNLLFAVQTRAKLAPGETPQAASDAWFAKVSVATRFCEKHPHTRLVFDRKASDLWPDRSTGEFIFHAVFACPACRCAWARCPPEFQETTFDTFDTSTPERAATLARCREFAAQVNTKGCGFMLLVGLPGSGKTRLACNVVRELNDSRDALYVRQAELTCALRATYGRKPDDEPTGPLEKAQKEPFLVLDEVGCHPLANDELLLLDELVKHRYEHRKPTVLISNLSLTGKPDAPGLKELLGDALTDRIREATGNGKFIVQFSGESYRRTTGETYLDGLG